MFQEGTTKTIETLNQSKVILKTITRLSRICTYIVCKPLDNLQCRTESNF